MTSAAEKYAGIEWLITATFGLHPDMNAIIADRIERCLQHASGADEEQTASGCDVCVGTGGCEFK